MTRNILQNFIPKPEAPGDEKNPKIARRFLSVGFPIIGLFPVKMASMYNNMGSNLSRLN